MHNNIENNKPDLFSERIKQKLADHQTVVNPPVWDAIASKMAAGKPRKRILFGWWLAAGLAASVALLLIFQPFTKQDTNTLSVNFNQSETKTELLTAKKSISEADKTSILASNNFVSKKLIKKTRKNANTALLISNPKLSTEPTIVATTEINKEVAKDSNTFIFDNQTYKNIVTEIATQNTDTSKSIELAAKNKLQLKQNDWVDPLKTNKESDWELIAMASSAGKSNSTNNQVAIESDFRSSVGSLNSLGTGLMKAKTLNTYIFPPESFSDKTYMAPVSVGLALGRKISDKISIETGVNYTFLHTILKSEQVDAQLKLHYIGIPLRFAYDFLNANKWTVYGTAGGMIEKGVWSVYEQNQHYNNSLITTNIEDKIAGFQFSINGSFGGAYNIYKNTSVYFEPKISYYFDSKQPMSIRTVNMIVVGFEGGFRYRF